MSTDNSEDSEATPPPVYLMYPQDGDEDVDLLRIAGVLWRGRWQIAIVTMLFTVAFAAYVIVATPIYRAEVLLMPNEQDMSQNLPAGIGGLASLAGIDIGASADSAEILAVLGSRVLIEEFIIDDDLMPILYADQWDGEPHGRQRDGVW